MLVVVSSNIWIINLLCGVKQYMLWIFAIHYSVAERCSFLSYCDVACAYDVLLDLRDYPYKVNSVSSLSRSLSWFPLTAVITQDQMVTEDVDFEERARVIGMAGAAAACGRRSGRSRG